MFKRTNPVSTAAFTSVFVVAFSFAGLSGWGTAPLTVDDGRPLDSRLIKNMHEAEWIVLWTQGLSERGGARMKTYAFMVGTFKWLSVLGPGFATSSAVASTRAGAAAAGSSATGQIAATELAGQAASLMAQSAANRAALPGVSRVAAGVFGRADAWAFEHMRKLGMNPRAGLSLHRKLVSQGAASNAFLLDEERLRAMQALVAGLPRDGVQAHAR